MDRVTGTTSSVARKLLMKSRRKLSDERSFPSTLMERGTSGRILTAAFRKASAGGVERREARGGKEGDERWEVTRKGGRKERRKKERESEGR